MTQTILVTGGAGFIGSNFVHHTLKNHPEYKIIILDALTYAGSTDNLPPESLVEHDDRVLFRYGNIMNADLVDALMSEADLVVHFAAETHVTRSIYDNRNFFETDVLGTQTLVNSALRHKEQIKKFIHISTSEVYGTALSEKIDEDHPLMPMSPYASAKCGADRLIYSYWQTYDLPLVTIRPFNMFGPRQHLEKVIPRFITSTILGEPLTVHGDGSAARDFMFADDLCRGIHLVLQADAKEVAGEVFNMASGTHRSVKSIAVEILERLNIDSSQISYIGDRPGQVFRHTGDWSKAKSVLGWSPKVSWDEGLEKTMAWYKSHQDFWKKQLWMRSIPIITESGKVELH
jgi:dTDP-glucose 4,6-dehydratase